jgi:SAM-dependent methyltransferase
MNTTTKKAFFGIDAPGLVLGFALGGPLLLLLGTFAVGRPGFIGSLSASLQGTGAGMIASAILMSFSSLVGKRIVAHRLIASLQLRGDERVLDVGCGRGLLLLEAARVLPRGRAVGIDLWNTRDQSGNASAATLANAVALGIEARVDIDTGDMRRLPYADASFDAIVSSLAIHNLPSAADRTQAVREIARVLAPGGRIALLDFRQTDRYADTLRECGLNDVKRSWPSLLMFPPVRIVRASRQRSGDQR